MAKELVVYSGFNQRQQKKIHKQVVKVNNKLKRLKAKRFSLIS